MLLPGRIASTTAKIPPVGYFFLDEKVAKKSRPNRNLLKQTQKFRKKTFFCGISSFPFFQQISEWPFFNLPIPGPYSGMNTYFVIPTKADIYGCLPEQE